MKAVVTLSSPRVSAACLASLLRATMLSKDAIMTVSPEATMLSLRALSIFFSWMFLMKVNGILYCWSMK